MHNNKQRDENKEEAELQRSDHDQSEQGQSPKTMNDENQYRGGADDQQTQVKEQKGQGMESTDLDELIPSHDKAGLSQRDHTSSPQDRSSDQGSNQTTETSKDVHREAEPSPFHPRDIHKERQDAVSHKIEHMKEFHSLPEGMKSITKEDAKQFIAHQDPIYANEDDERALSAKVVMSAMINEVKSGEHEQQPETEEREERTNQPEK